MSSYITSIHGVTLTPEGEILIASREGAFRSSDSGATWEHVVNGIPDKNISSIAYDQGRKRLLATSTLQAWCSRARTAAAPGIADLIRDIRCAASASCADASWEQLRLTA